MNVLINKQKMAIFLTVGFIGMIVDIAVFRMFSNLIDDSFSRIISIFFAIFVTWIGNRTVTFKQNRELFSYVGLAKEFFLYFSGSLFGGVINYLAFCGIIYIIPLINRDISILLSSAIAALFNFVFYNFVVFKKPI